MSFKCIVCGKQPKAGKSISHSHKASNRWFKPNLQRIKFIYQDKPQRGYVCTACIRSGKIQKTL